MESMAQAELANVFCRIGSSERLCYFVERLSHVFCRIGSSEKLIENNAESIKVFCRIGSSEMARSLWDR